MGRTRFQLRGDRAEQRALRYLARNGQTCLARNFRTRGGEVDLVTLDGETLVFVEVRARQSLAFGYPEETVGWRKRRRLVQAARVFLTRYPQHGARPCRFDVVAFYGDRIHLITDAFRPDEGGFWG